MSTQLDSLGTVYSVIAALGKSGKEMAEMTQELLVQNDKVIVRFGQILADPVQTENFNNYTTPEQREFAFALYELFKKLQADIEALE